MRILLGYPDAQAERQILASDWHGCKRWLNRNSCEHCKGKSTASAYPKHWWTTCSAWPTAAAATKPFLYGLSTRAALALLQAARAWALLEGQDYVIPEDVQEVLPSVASHRLQGVGEWANAQGDTLTQRLLGSVDVIG